jgi:hypothetical protein
VYSTDDVPAVARFVEFVLAHAPKTRVWSSMPKSLSDLQLYLQLMTYYQARLCTAHLQKSEDVLHSVTQSRIHFAYSWFLWYTALLDDKAIPYHYLRIVVHVMWWE